MVAQQRTSAATVHFAVLQQYSMYEMWLESWYIVDFTMEWNMIQPITITKELEVSVLENAFYH